LREREVLLISSVAGKARRQSKTTLRRILAEDAGNLLTEKLRKLPGISPKLLQACTGEMPPPPLSLSQPAAPARRPRGGAAEKGDLLGYCSSRGEGRFSLASGLRPLLICCCFFDYLLFALLFRSLFSFQLHRSLEVDCLALFVLMSDLCIGGRWQGLSPFASRPPQMAWYEMWCDALPLPKGRTPVICAIPWISR
jgi:hypothetical protein